MTAPTVYHLRNNDGVETFTGTISPAPGGGSQPFYVHVPFAFNSPNILTGMALHTPATGDLFIADTSISIVTAFDGTTPRLTVVWQGEDPELADLLYASGDFVDAQWSGSAHAVQPGASLGSQVLAIDATPLVLILDDGSGGDPGSAVGAGTVILAYVPAA